ncbi:MAG TPA: glutathione S-transferase [Methylomirabilota bacterium]|nr:glutathione S-transferase [Methylomirabilota bacterium]
MSVRALPLSLADCVNDVCPWTGRPVSADALTRYKGRVIGFADRASRDTFVSALVAFETAILPAPRICAAVAA